jgi:hypothetical protein
MAAVGEMFLNVKLVDAIVMHRALHMKTVAVI